MNAIAIAKAIASAPAGSDVRPTAPVDAAPPLAAAVERLACDGLVAFPTETVWGLAARAESERAMAALRAWKGRQADRPIALLVAGPEVLPAAGFDPDPLARRVIAAFWPGPLTIVLPCARRHAPGIARADGAVGLRCSPHPVAAALARAAADAGLGPLTATSLNASGQPAARSLAEARALCGSDVGAPLVLDLDGRDADGRAPSSVLDLTSDPPRLLRRGEIDEAALRAAGICVEGVATMESRDDEQEEGESGR